MKVKSPLRLAVAILVLLMIIYAGFAGAVSIISGKPIHFGIFSRGGIARGSEVEDFVVVALTRKATERT